MKMEDPIVLIGCMGSGKSTVGRLLASRTGLRFIDLDEEFVKRTGKGIGQFFKESGEKEFRHIESEIFRENIKLKDVVISCGGGIVLDEENRETLRKMKKVILLTADTSTLASRLENNDSRPLLENHDKEKRIKDIMEQRGELYLYVADMVIDTSGLSKEDVIDIIIENG